MSYDLDELAALEAAATLAPNKLVIVCDDDTAKYIDKALIALPAMLADLRELELRRKGEWICPRCHLRQDNQYPKAEF